MPRIDALAARKLEVAKAACGRWLARESERTGVRLRELAAGPGAGDTAERQARYLARERQRIRRTLPAAPVSPDLLERQIGPTLDLSVFAPDEAARNAGRPVARIVELPQPGVLPQGFGTGFLVTPRLLLTNHHVLPTLAEARGVGANFLHEMGSAGLQLGSIFELDPEVFYASDPQLDYALVAVRERSLDGQALASFGIVRFIAATGKILLGHPVNVIQHPNGGPKQYATTQNKLLDLLDDGFLHYSTDTLPGSSGSPAFNRHWEAIGLHHSGVPLVRNEQVIAQNGQPWDPRTMSDAEVTWIANEGVRASSIVSHLKLLRMDPKAQALLDQLLERSNDPLLAEDPAPVPAVHAPALSEATREDRMASTVIYVTGSTTINVGPGSIGQPSTTAAAEQARQPSLNGGASAAIVATEKKLRFDKKYRQRQGYDEKFLDGFTIPLPGVTTERAAELLKGDARGPLILHYHHFSLAMNRKRRLQMWSAVNVDYDPDRKSTRDRKEFGTDTWIADPRIPAELQIDDDDFYAPATKIDRGHIVRREDNAWGGSELEIEYANSDTFHWTNCTPQHEAFNREQFSGLWGRFEAHITTSIDAVGHRATIFAGPVLDNQRDPSKDFGNGPVQYPLKFWKVVAAVSRRSGQPTLMAWGFLFDQSGPVDRFGIEAIDFRRFKREQRSLEKLSTLTGVTFPRGLLDADVLKGTNPNETISVDSLESIRLDHA